MSAFEEEGPTKEKYKSKKYTEDKSMKRKKGGHRQKRTGNVERRSRA